MPDFYRTAHALLRGMMGHYPLPDSIRPPHRCELDFVMQKQAMPKWCWAAAACSISHYYDGKDGICQAELVAHRFGLDASSVPDDDWNREALLVEGLQLVGCKVAFHYGPSSFRSVLKALNNRDPVCIQILWRDQDGDDSDVRHAVVISACWLDRNDKEFYMVGDPEEGALEEWSEMGLRSAYMAQEDWPGGRWEHTFFVTRLL